MKDKIKEKAAERRERLAKALETAYNKRGNYRKVILEIKSYGDTFSGSLLVQAAGVPHYTEGRRSWLDVYGNVPKPSKEWDAFLYYVKVSHRG